MTDWQSRAAASSRRRLLGWAVLAALPLAACGRKGNLELPPSSQSSKSGQSSSSSGGTSGKTDTSAKKDGTSATQPQSGVSP